MKIQYKYLIYSVFGLFLSGSCFAQVPAQPLSNAPLQLDPAIRKGILKNGFTYYLRRNTAEKGKAVLYLVNKAGSILENDSQQGLAHFTEHMSFNGTKNFPGNKLVDYLEKSGVRFGADLNAYTGYDETVYQLPIAFDSPELISNGIQVMRDWADGALLETTEINKERGVILEEKRMGEGAAKRMQEKVMPVLLNHSLYARRSPIGTESVLKNFDPDSLRVFYKDWYRPNLQSLIIVGDIDMERIEALVKERFSDLKNPENERIREKREITLNGENHFMAISDSENSKTSIQVIIKHEARKSITALDYRDGLLRSLFNMMMQSRFSAISQKPDLSYIAAGASVAHFIANLDIFSASVTLKKDRIQEGFKAIWSSVSAIKRGGFTQSELDRAKGMLKAGMDGALAERDKIPSSQYVQEYTRNFLEQEAAPGIEMEATLVNDFLPGISLADLKQYAQQYIVSANRDIIIEGPAQEQSGFPDEKTLLGWMASAEGTGTAFSDVTKTSPLLKTLPNPGKIISEKMLGESGVIELKLGNGVKVVLKPTDFKNDQINIFAMAPGGTSIYSDSLYQSAANAAAIVMGGGLGDHDPSELRNILNARRVQISPYISERSQGIAGGSSVADFETALQLVHLYFTHPRKDSVVFVSGIEKSRSMLMNADVSPDKIFADSINSVLNHGSIRRSGPTMDKLSQVNLDDALSIYRERFSTAEGFTFIITGSFDVNKIKPLLERYIGSLPSLRAQVQPKDLKLEIPSGRISRTVYAGKGNKATVRLVLSGSFDYSEQNLLDLQAIKAILQLRLLERLRETEGGVYTPGTSLSYSRVPRSRYALTVNFSCSPENVEKLIAASWEEMNRIKREGPQANDLQKFRAEESSVIKSALHTNEFWSTFLIEKYTYKDENIDPATYERNLGSLSVSGLKKAASTYLNDKNYIRLVLLPAVKSK